MNHHIFLCSRWYLPLAFKIPTFRHLLRGCYILSIKHLNIFLGKAVPLYELVKNQTPQFDMEYHQLYEYIQYLNKYIYICVCGVHIHLGCTSKYRVANLTLWPLLALLTARAAAVMASLGWLEVNKKMLYGDTLGCNGHTVGEKQWHDIWVKLKRYPWTSRPSGVAIKQSGK